MGNYTCSSEICQSNIKILLQILSIFCSNSMILFYCGSEKWSGGDGTWQGEERTSEREKMGVGKVGIVYLHLNPAEV